MPYSKAVDCYLSNPGSIPGKLVGDSGGIREHIQQQLL